MARVDLLANLIEAGSEGNYALFVETAQAIIQEEESKQHHILAERLKRALKVKESLAVKQQDENIRLETNNSPFTVIKPKAELSDIVLSEYNQEIINAFIEERLMKDYLRSHGMNPRNKVLLVGKPGNGKTTLAEVLAYELMLPLYFVNYEMLINSLLGESLQRIKQLFHLIYNENCVLFFDEFDAISKSRADFNEVGEVKRIVNLLLTNIDKLSTNTIIIATTNHSQLLDKAILRRFQIVLELNPPETEEIIEYLSSYEKKHKIDFLYTKNYLAKELKGSSFSDLEEFSNNIRRSFLIHKNKKMNFDRAKVKQQLEITKQTKSITK
jgi:AAA+ superfamily predicted ATPase